MRAAVAHADLPAALQLRRRAGARHTLRDRWLPELRAAGVGLVVGAVFVHPLFLPEGALRAALEQVDAVLEEAADCGAAVVTTAAELDAAVAAERLALVLALEGAEPLTSPALLGPFFRLGVRLLGLTWNGRNAYADGCSLDGGLTAAGRDLARAAWALGMALDVSHLSDAGFRELLALGDGPVLASHSNCRALCGHRRNVTDGQLAALGARGAVVGVNQVRFLARRPGSPGTLDDLCAHLLRTEAVAGRGTACLGLDLARGYDEAVPRPLDDWRARAAAEPEDILEGFGAIRRLEARLLAGGLPPADVDGIVGGNLTAFLRRALPPG